MKSIIALVLFVACATQVYSACVKKYPCYDHHVSTLNELHSYDHHQTGFHHGILNVNHPSVSSYYLPGPCSCGNCLSCKKRPYYPFYAKQVHPHYRYPTGSQRFL
uniref:Uncharacterized protein n=1 Tax=Anopheles stephensi TaxID=30069 RepID=A0A182YJ72_ANOST